MSTPQQLHVASKTHPSTGTTGDVTGTLASAIANAASLIAVKPAATTNSGAAFLGIL